MIFNAAERHRMRVGRIGAGDQHAVGVGEVLVGAGRRIGAERLLVGGDRARHAQARVGVDVVAANQPLHRLVEDVVVLGEQLPGDVERHRVRAVLVDHVGEALRGDADRLVPPHALARFAAHRAQLRVEQARLRAGGEMQRRTLGAQPAEVGRMRRVAAHAADALAVVLDQHAAAHAAVGTGRLGFHLHLRDRDHGSCSF
jgi:hypothetical protein